MHVIGDTNQCRRKPMTILRDVYKTTVNWILFTRKQNFSQTTVGTNNQRWKSCTKNRMHLQILEQEEKKTEHQPKFAHQSIRNMAKSIRRTTPTKDVQNRYLHEWIWHRARRRRTQLSIWHTPPHNHTPTNHKNNREASQNTIPTSGEEPIDENGQHTNKNRSNLQHEENLEEISSRKEHQNKMDSTETNNTPYPYCGPPNDRYGKES
jgi:hypothetical protein